MKTSKTYLFILMAYIMNLSCTRDFSPVVTTAQDREFSPVEKTLVQSSNAFGFRLFQEVNREEGGKNIFLSPLSVSMALGMTLNGAAGVTETDMRRTLGFGDLPQNDVNASYGNLLNLLPSIDPKTAMEIASSIWYRQGYPVLPAFIDVSRVFFSALVRGIDFSSPQAPDTINAWISDKTHGKIDRMIEEIDPATVMFLINAVYFKGTWTYEFDVKSTRDDFFTQSDGSTVPCKMMRQKTTLGYFETETFQAVDIPYGNGRYSMSVFLPKAGRSMDAFIASLTAGNWPSLKNGFSEREITLHFPKFKLEYEIKLNDVLSSMGMAVAFQAGAADFSRIAGGRDLYIDQVKHKAFVEVDEKGTEAAAATVVEIRETSAGPGNDILMRVDRPFVFVIRENSSDAFLFMGRVLSPSL
jgi:serine protease inhibitor